jgi:hypothetical protein
MSHSTTADFIGTWRLLDYSFVHDDGVVERPWGVEVRGYLLYTPEGYMSGNLSPARDWASRRARLAERFSGASKLRASGMTGRSPRRDYIAYSGRYSVEGDTVTHHVEVSLFPNWIGRPEVRYFQFENDRLTLRTPPIKVGKHTVVAQLVWQRVRG